MGIPGFFKWLTDKDHYPDVARYCVEYEPYYGNYFKLIFSYYDTFYLVFSDKYGVYQPVCETEPNPNGIEVHF